MSNSSFFKQYFEPSTFSQVWTNQNVNTQFSANHGNSSRQGNQSASLDPTAKADGKNPPLDGMSSAGATKNEDFLPKTFFISTIF